jgi:hypothetical protein
LRLVALYDTGQLRPRLLPVVGVGGIMIALAFALGGI